MECSYWVWDSVWKMLFFRVLTPFLARGFLGGWVNVPNKFSFRFLTPVREADAWVVSKVPKNLVLDT